MKTNPRKDFTQTPLSIVEQATVEVPKPKTLKQEACGKGGKAGGAARATSLTPAKKKSDSEEGR